MSISAFNKEVKPNPSPTSIPAMMSVNLTLMRLHMMLPKKAPRQKKHIVSVKLSASDESLHIKTSLNGISSLTKR